MAFNAFSYQPSMMPPSANGFSASGFANADPFQSQQQSMGMVMGNVPPTMAPINNVFSSPLLNNPSMNAFSSPINIQQPSIPTNNPFSNSPSSIQPQPSSIPLNQSLFSSSPSSSSQSPPSSILPPPMCSPSFPNAPFLCLINGRPPITSFQPVDSAMRKFLLQIQKGGMVDRMTFTLLQSSVLSPLEGVGLYAASYPYTNWSFIGAVSTNFPTAILSMPWKNNLTDTDAQIGLSVESIDFLSAQQTKLMAAESHLSTALIPSASSNNINAMSSSSSSTGMISSDEDPSKFLDDAKGIARDLYTFMASFSQTGGQYKNLGDVLVIPTNCIDNWFSKFQTKHNREPYFWRKSSLDTVD